MFDPYTPRMVEAQCSLAILSAKVFIAEGKHMHGHVPDSVVIFFSKGAQFQKREKKQLLFLVETILEGFIWCVHGDYDSFLKT